MTSWFKKNKYTTYNPFKCERNYKNNLEYDIETPNGLF